MIYSRSLVGAAAALTMTFAVADGAFAACTRLAASVNDYGKDGPIRDAKSLLDKYVAKWASDRKITGYNTGPKEVTCELFLDVILFDEYTCKAAATVCWNGPLPPGHTTEASLPVVNKAAEGGPVRAKAPKAAAEGGAPAAAAAPIATGSVKAPVVAAPKAPVATPAAVPAAPAAPAAPTPAPAAT